MKVSILSISNHYGGLDVFEDDLRRQTIWKRLVATSDVEWIFVDELKDLPGRKEAFLDVGTRLGVECFHTTAPDYEPPRYTKLNRSLNWGLDLARGEYIFYLDDYIWIPDDCLEQMLQVADATDWPLLITPRTDRAKFPAKEWVGDLTHPYSIYKRNFVELAALFPNVPTFWQDQRTRINSVIPYDWEPPAGLAPRQLLIEAHGYDESMDHGYASGHADIARKILEKHPEARVHFMPQVHCINIDQREYWDDRADLHGKVVANQAIVIERVEGKKAVVGFDDIKPGHVYDARENDINVDLGPKEPDPLSICFWMPDIGGWSKIDPTNPFARALGGRETACIRLAQELAKLGACVAIVAPMTVSKPIQVGSVDWVPLDGFDLKFLNGYDVVVSMERGDVFEKVRAKKLNVLHMQCTYSLYDLNKLDRKIDHYFLISKFQDYTLRSQMPKINADKCVVFGNAVDLERFDSLQVETIPGRLVWSSAPDRGLHHLLRWWPRLKEAIPELSLRVFYDLESNLGPHQWGMSLQSEWYYKCKEGLTQPGVEYFGPIAQDLLARYQKQADAFVYPCDPVSPTETFCITALENCAARVPMILSTADCLQEIYGGVRDAAWFLDLPVQDDAWVQTIVELFKDKEQLRQNVERGRALAEHFTWANLARRWLDFLTRRVTLDNPDAINDLVEQEEMARLALPARG